jgi:methionine biosynthesis protein MetW
LSTEPKIVQETTSPDQNAAGLLDAVPDPLRYGGHLLDPDEVGGIVARMLPERARVLDVGCGTGSLARLLVDTRHAEVIGIEPDAARAKLALGHGLEVYVGYLNAEFVARFGPFDIVLFGDVLEHLPNPQGVLLLSRAALKPSGSVIVSVPNVAHWSVRLRLLLGRFDYASTGIMDATHLRWFTADTIKSLLTSSGFRVAEHRVTANPFIPDNTGVAPLRWLSAKRRAHLLKIACRRLPTLCGAQHVVRAEMA